MSTTLITKRSQSLCAKLLIGVTLVTSLASFPHLVYADENPLNDLYETIKGQFRLSNTQVNNLMLVKEHSQYSGQTEALQAIMLQETEAGRNVKSNQNCHGIMQILTSTAAGVVKKHDDLRVRFFGTTKPTPKLVATKLKTDVVFSIEVADRVMAGSLEKCKNVSCAILAYNQGDRSIQTVKNPMRITYVRDVSAKIKNVIQPMNKILAPLALPADADNQSNDSAQKEGLII